MIKINGERAQPFMVPSQRRTYLAQRNSLAPKNDTVVSVLQGTNGVTLVSPGDDVRKRDQFLSSLPDDAIHLPDICAWSTHKYSRADVERLCRDLKIAFQSGTYHANDGTVEITRQYHPR